MAVDNRFDAAIRPVLDLALLLIAGAYLVAALVGLPLFGDGGYYFFKLATDGELLLPNLRYTALLPQLPGLVAMQITADSVVLRHVFSVSYQSLPWLSLLACWLLLRARLPWLMLLPMLSLVGTLLNFSAVSELLSGLYLVWPLLLAMTLSPERAWVRGSAFVSAPLLLALHPMAFVLAFGLAAAAAFVAWHIPDWRRAWRRLAIWLALSGLARLIWTLVGANVYERSNLTDTGLAHYLLTETTAQHLLLATLLVCAVLVVAASLWRHKQRNRLARVGLVLACLLLALLSVAVSAEFLLGFGIKLKAAATFVVAVLLMGMAFLSAWLSSERLAVAGRSGAEARTGNSSGVRPGISSGVDHSVWPYRLVVAAILFLVLAKSAAWWTATRGLQDAIADSSGACIPFTVDQPFGLQWPWMNIVDDWVAPINALAFRPRIPALHGQGIEPMPLLLPGDGCRLLERNGDALLTDWMQRPWGLLDARFGPLRQSAY